MTEGGIARTQHVDFIEITFAEGGLEIVNFNEIIYLY